MRARVQTLVDTENVPIAPRTAAGAVQYDNSASGVMARTVQEAVDTLARKIAEPKDDGDVSVSEEDKARWDGKQDAITGTPMLIVGIDKDGVTRALSPSYFSILIRGGGDMFGLLEYTNYDSIPPSKDGHLVTKKYVDDAIAAAIAAAMGGGDPG